MNAKSPTDGPPDLTYVATALEREMIKGTPAVQALRQRFGPQIPISVRTAQDDTIPLALQALSNDKEGTSYGPAQEIIAVVLDASTNGLAIVACRLAKEMESFRQRNGVIKTGLVTIWNDWHLLWLRSDERPKNLICEDSMWLTQGTIPISFVGQQEPSIQTDGQVLEITFANIRWPEALCGFFRIARLRRLYGPYFRRRRGRLVLNDPFWANWLAEELGVRYHPELREFRRPVNCNKEKVTLEAMIRLVGEVLLRTAGQSSEAFPMEELNPSRIRQLVRLMKVVSRAAPSETKPAGPGDYCAKCLQLQFGSTLRTAEIWLDYMGYCLDHNLVRYSKGQFLRRLPTHVRELFGLTRSHDILRGRRRYRGFHGLTFLRATPIAVTPKAPA